MKHVGMQTCRLSSVIGPGLFSTHARYEFLKAKAVHHQSVLRMAFRLEPLETQIFAPRKASRGEPLARHIVPSLMLGLRYQ